MTLDILSRNGESYEETVEAARRAAEQLKQVLELKILGKELAAMPFRVKIAEVPSGYDCGIGHIGKARAVGILPAGKEFESQDQIAISDLWGVEMEEVDGSGNKHTIGLTEFLPRDEIEALFATYFKDVDIDYLFQEKDGPELRAQGEKIDITHENKTFIEEGKRAAVFHIHNNSQFQEVKDLIEKTKKNKLYFALIGAIHSAKPGSVISVPEDDMRTFADQYIKFAMRGTYLLIECGGTISINGIIQNIKQDIRNSVPFGTIDWSGDSVTR